VIQSGRSRDPKTHNLWSTGMSHKLPHNAWCLLTITAEYSMIGASLKLHLLKKFKSLWKMFLGLW